MATIPNIQPPPKYISGLPIPTPAEPATYIIGIDEVARGCLAGPVVASAICLNIDSVLNEYNTNSQIPKIADSKKLTPAKRAMAETWIKRNALTYSYGIGTVAEIDANNIRNATFMAMSRALDDCLMNLKPLITPVHIKVYIDGNAFKYISTLGHVTSVFPGTAIDFETVIKGDATDLHIACASILAKEYRDKLLDELVIAEPGLAVYNWKQNRAYGTKEHFDLLRKNGISLHHRRSFLKGLA